MVGRLQCPNGREGATMLYFLDSETASELIGLASEAWNEPNHSNAAKAFEKAVLNLKDLWAKR